MRKAYSTARNAARRSCGIRQQAFLSSGYLKGGCAGVADCALGTEKKTNESAEMPHVSLDEVGNDEEMEK